MSEHAEKPAEDAGKDKGKKKAGMGALLTKLPVLLGGVMVIEGVVLFAGFKFFGGGAPHPAAAELVKAEAAEPEKEGAAADGEKGKAAEGDAKKDGKGEKEAPTKGEVKEEAPAKGEAKPEKAEAKPEGKEGAEKAGDKAAIKHGKHQPVELPVVEFRAPNKVSGKTFIYDVSIYAVTKGENEAKLRAVLADREATVKDRIRTIIAQSDPEKLGGGSEPGLETLRRQIKHQLDDLAGDEIVDEVLIPRCIPFRVD